MASEDDYIDRAAMRLLEVMDSELALVKPEAIARLSEAYNRDDRLNYDSHIVGQALSRLEDDDRIVTRTATSKGGHSITTYEPADQRKRTTEIAAAAARKRALYSRYLGWAQGTRRYKEGLLGPAGEAATRGAILASTALQPAQPGAGAVSNILNVDLPGPADSGGYMVPIIDGIPQPAVTLIFEVKNIREWIYPSSSEIFQVLHKAMFLQRARPAAPIVPILVCRAAHKTAFWMASQLGFLIIDMGVQYVGTRVEEEPFMEVRNGLFFNDLRLGDGPSLRVRDRLAKHLPSNIHLVAAKWATTAQDTATFEYVTALRGRLGRDNRNDYMTELRALNKARGQGGGW